MKIKTGFSKYDLVYIRPARTSRGEMQLHEVYYVWFEDVVTGKKGWGEAAPLPGLSIDHSPEFTHRLNQFCQLLNEGVALRDLDLQLFPSIRFAFETAELSLRQPDPFVLYDSPFIRGEGIPINGLVWMNTDAEMLKEAEKKISEGFDCIKFKVGALDFDSECRMLEAFRKKNSAFRVTIRLDANGAFAPEDARQKLKDLARFEIHSLEQPIKAGQMDELSVLCEVSKIPIALDEELIGINPASASIVLKQINPAYIILKPTLLGGIEECNKWRTLAAKNGIGYWATSALESNIGLNVISQWAATFHSSFPQGLGTGALYRNNVPFPLQVESGELYFEASATINTVIALNALN